MTLRTCESCGRPGAWCEWRGVPSAARTDGHVLLCPVCAFGATVAGRATLPIGETVEYRREWQKEERR